MDVDFGLDFNPVVPVDFVSKVSPPATPIVSVEKVESDHDIFEAGILLRSSISHTQSNLIDKPKHSALKRVVDPKICQTIPVPLWPIVIAFFNNHVSISESEPAVSLDRFSQDSSPSTH